MSKVRNPTFRMTNASIHICGRAHQRSFSLAMLSPERGGHRLQFDCLLQHGIVPVPLHEIGASHKGPVFAGPSVVMPQVEVHEIDGMGEWRTAERTVFP